MKNGQPPEPIAFRLATVDLGMEDEDGRPVTSAVLVDALYEPEKDDQRKPLGSNQEKVRQAYDQLRRRMRKNLEESGRDPDIIRITQDDLKAECTLTRNRFYEALQGLLKKKILELEKGFLHPGPKSSTRASEVSEPGGIIYPPGGSDIRTVTPAGPDSDAIRTQFGRYSDE
jgi:hypothetical protein